MYQCKIIIKKLFLINQVIKIILFYLIKNLKYIKIGLKGDKIEIIKKYLHIVRSEI